MPSARLSGPTFDARVPVAARQHGSHRGHVTADGVTPDVFGSNPPYAPDPSLSRLAARGVRRAERQLRPGPEARAGHRRLAPSEDRPWMASLAAACVSVRADVQAVSVRETIAGTSSPGIPSLSIDCRGRIDESPLLETILSLGHITTERRRLIAGQGNQQRLPASLGCHQGLAPATNSSISR